MKPLKNSRNPEVTNTRGVQTQKNDNELGNPDTDILSRLATPTAI